MAARSDISTTIAGITFKNPVLVASGTFGYGNELADLLPLRQLGGIITKTLTITPRPGNPPPRIAEVTGGMLNTIGLQNVGIDTFIEDSWDALARIGVPVIISIAGGTADEYAAAVRRLNGIQGMAGIELNLSCPNLQKKIICQDQQLVREIVESAVAHSTVPVIAKLSPMVQDIAGLAETVRQAGAAALSLVNTFPGMAIDIATWKPKLSTISGGMSGPAIKPLALRCVWEVARQVALPVIGGGGISSASDAIEFFLAGAAAVSIGTANFTDPRSPLTIAAGINAYLQARHIASLDGIIGKMKRG
jgi:dihydroorotate dehydrogenase (NAD+) catalytic subunit